MAKIADFFRRVYSFLAMTWKRSIQKHNTLVNRNLTVTVVHATYMKAFKVSSHIVTNYENILNIELSAWL